ncbi:Uncharacterized protein YR821_1768 [Yersinia ruckeri]|uniref:Uncharacterized protein n=1 Tax=Yersinia ruckeri TaxID=29486 RepID=A0A0A8VCU7_YERRU|nr:hypothetical protein yruck0001_12910 [Yersinia ruckeri ATCC 29473]QTD76690.1 Uncharacterized protein YR821_1768 [Yersinia ruckeri]CEK27587.1 hypothetical protein CSF007_9170 [Yersinia ruckeri]
MILLYIMTEKGKNNVLWHFYFVLKRSVLICNVDFLWNTGDIYGHEIIGHAAFVELKKHSNVCCN